MDDPACSGIVADEVTWLLPIEGWPQAGAGQDCSANNSHHYAPSSCTIGQNTIGSAQAAKYKAGLYQLIAELSQMMLSKRKFPFYSTQTHLNFYP